MRHDHFMPQLERSPRSKPIVSFCSEIFLFCFVATVLIFFIAGLLYLLRFERVDPDKTRRIEFGRFAEQNRKRRREGKPETFDFLGFTHISGKNRLGRFTVKRKTIRKRTRAKLREIKQQLRARMHDPVRQTGQWLKSIVQGHFNYYAVPGNLDSLGVFRERILGHWRHTVRRRSQRPFSWTRTLALAARWLPEPRVLHPYPAVRFAASHPR